MATRLLTIGMDITDVQKFLGHEGIACRIYGETGNAILRRKFEQVIDKAGKNLVERISEDRGEVAGAFDSDLLEEPRRLST